MRLVILSCLILLGCENKSGLSKPEPKDRDSLSKLEPEPLYQEQWAINYDKAFYDTHEINQNAHINSAQVNLTGKGIKIAVIDSELDTNHPEFKNNIINTVNSADGSNDVSCKYLHDSDYELGDCGHGSAVTGIIASNINGSGLRGIAPNVQIIFIQLDLYSDLDDDAILNAFDFAEKFDADIVSNSWGTEDVSPVVADKINNMATNGRDGKGILVVFASGNDNIEVPDDESMLESVIGVGASDEENLRAEYSNYGDGLDIVAPGGDILGITTTGYREEGIGDFIKAEDYELSFSGTSASAPIVSAALALLLEKNPQLTRQQVQQLLKERSDKIGNFEYIQGHNKYYGFGKLNVGRLLE